MKWKEKRGNERRKGVKNDGKKTKDRKNKGVNMKKEGKWRNR